MFRAAFRGASRAAAAGARAGPFVRAASSRAAAHKGAALTTLGLLVGTTGTAACFSFSDLFGGKKDVDYQQLYKDIAAV